MSTPSIAAIATATAACSTPNDAGVGTQPGEQRLQDPKDDECDGRDDDAASLARTSVTTKTAMIDKIVR